MLLFAEFLMATAALVLGLVVGSFLNVCIYRIPLGITVVSGRSFCPSCKKTIAWYDLVPVLSFLVLRGRCRSCGSPISPRYPAVELLNGLLWLLCCLFHGFTPRALVLALGLSALVVAGFIDHDTGLIPDRLSVFLLLLAAASLFLPGFASPLSRVLGLLIPALPMLLAAKLFGGFGGGDVKLCAAFGALAGLPLSLLAALLSSVTGAAYGLLLVKKKGAGRKTAFPFGPFLALGMGAALLFGERLVSFYLSLFSF